MKANTAMIAPRLMGETQTESVKMGGGRELGSCAQVPSVSRTTTSRSLCSAAFTALESNTALACRTLLGVLLYCALMCGNASAQTSRYDIVAGIGYVYNKSNEVVFELRFFNPSDGDFYRDVSSTRAFAQGEMEAICQAALYWVDALKPYGEMPYTAKADMTVNVHFVQPVVINIGTYNDDNNAEGFALDTIPSETSEANDPYLVQKSMALLADGTYVPPDTVDGHFSYGVMVIGTGWNALRSDPSQVGRGAADLTTAAIHEFGHILGISSPMEINRYTGINLVTGDYTAIYQFPSELTRWQALLRDNNGNSSVPRAYGADGKPIDYDPTSGGKYIFDTGDPNSSTQPANFTFVGANALEVYYDGNEQLIREKTAAGQGVPLQGLVLNEYSYLNDPNFINVEDPNAPNNRWVFDASGTLSHIDARNSTMSWQMYRNYPMFLEVELAALQDLGYDIERRNFFGRSFYVDGTTAVNDTPFWHWGENELGGIVWIQGGTKWGTTGYQVGTPNKSVYGIGLHLFANNLNILQRGTISIGPDKEDLDKYVTADAALQSAINAYWKAFNGGTPEELDKAALERDRTEAEFRQIEAAYRRLGAGTAGIRIDGVNNTLTIDKETTVTVLGTNGIGLLASYGKDHHIIHQGTLTTWNPATTGNLRVDSKTLAKNLGETAVRFDFGEPYVGARLGSYAFDPYYGAMAEGNIDPTTGAPLGGYPEDLQGPLVKAFDVTGTIIGGSYGHGIPVVTSGREDRMIVRDNRFDYKDSIEEYLRRMQNIVADCIEEQHITVSLEGRFINVPLNADVTYPDSDDLIRVFENGNLEKPSQLTLSQYISNRDIINIEITKIAGDIQKTIQEEINQNHMSLAQIAQVQADTRTKAQDKFQDLIDSYLKEAKLFNAYRSVILVNPNDGSIALCEKIQVPGNSTDSPELPEDVEIPENMPEAWGPLYVYAVDPDRPEFTPYSSNYYTILMHEKGSRVDINSVGDIRAPGYAILDPNGLDPNRRLSFDSINGRDYYSNFYVDNSPGDITYIFRDENGGNVDVWHWDRDNNGEVMHFVNGGWQRVVMNPNSHYAAFIIDYYDRDYQGNYIGDQAYVRNLNPQDDGNWPTNSFLADQALIRDYILRGEVLTTPLWEAYVTPDQNTIDLMPVGGAAIYIAGNQQVTNPYTGEVYRQGGSHVEAINIMQGASIQGDIISHWNSRKDRDDSAFNAALYDKGTMLTFGLKPGADGAATSEPDPDFKFVFKDNINYYETVTRAYVNGRPEEKDINDINGRPEEKDILRWGYFNYYDPEEEASTPETLLLSGFPSNPTDPTDTTASYLGVDDYSHSLYKIGNYVYAGPGLGRYNLTDSWEMAGKIDLRFAGGYTEFRPNDEDAYRLRDENGVDKQLKISRSFVNSVVIDPGATFSLGTDYLVIGRDATGQEIKTKITTSLLVMRDERLTDSGTFINNGRFSGEGTVMVGASKEQQRYVIAPLYNETGTIAYLPPDIVPSENETILPMAYYSANGTLVNRGTIAPGPNNGYGEPDEWVGIKFVKGRKTGVLAIGGNLDMSVPSSVYEVTIADCRKTTAPAWAETNGGIERVDIPIDPNGWGNGGCDMLVVSGTTTLGGTLVVHVTPGDYSSDPTVYTIIRSEGGYTEGTNFENFESYFGFMTFESSNLNRIDPHITDDGKDCQFTVIRDAEYFTKHGKTYNERSVATAIDNSYNKSYRVAFSLGDNSYDSADVRDMYNQLGAHVRANSALMNLWNPSETVFRRIGYGNGQMETGSRGRVNWQRMLGKTSKMLGQEPTRRIRSGSLWADTLYHSFTAEADYDGNSGNYQFSRTGVMVGVEGNLTPYSAVGGVIAYNLGNTRQRGDKVDSNDYIFGAYFVCAPFNEFEFKAYLGLGFQDYKMERNIYNAAIMDNNPNLSTSGPARYKSDFVGNTLNMSLELARPLMLHPTFILRPTLGVDSQYLWQNSSAEKSSQGTDIYTLSFRKMDYHRALFRAGFSSETTGQRGGIRMRAFYVAQFDGDNFPDSSAAFASGGQAFNVHGVDLGGEFLNLGIGAHFWLDGEKTASLFCDYDSEIYGTKKKTLSHTVQFGYLQTF